jgi:hypothetical protein
MEQVEEQIRDVDADAPEAEETDAPGPDPKDGDADDASAYREFLADRRTIRYGDTEGNRSKLLDYLLRFDRLYRIASRVVPRIWHALFRVVKNNLHRAAPFVHVSDAHVPESLAPTPV